MRQADSHVVIVCVQGLMSREWETSGPDARSG